MFELSSNPCLQPPLLFLLEEHKSTTVRVDEKRNLSRKNRSALTEETQDASQLISWHRMDESPGKLYLFHSAVLQSCQSRTSRENLFFSSWVGDRSTDLKTGAARRVTWPWNHARHHRKCVWRLNLVKKDLGPILDFCDFFFAVYTFAHRE